MSAIELQLLATLVDQGNIDPLLDGRLQRKYFLSMQGLSLYDFIRNYSTSTRGEGRVPTRTILEKRFGQQLPPTTGIEDVGALVHELRIEHLRSEMRVLAEAAATVAHSTDPLADAAEFAQKTLSIIEEANRSKDLLELEGG